MLACCAAPSRKKNGRARPDRSAGAAAALSLSPDATPTRDALSPLKALKGSEAERAASPAVVGSPLPNDNTDSPRNRCSSEPLGVEALRARTGRAASMFRDIRSPARSELLPTSPPGPRAVSEPEGARQLEQEQEDEEEEEQFEEQFVAIVVPNFPEDNVRLVTVLLADGSEVEVDVPSGLPAGEQFVVNVAEAVRRQRRQRFLEEEATRDELLSEIEVLSWSLTATVAATRIQGFVRRRWYSLALIRNAKAMRALVMEAQSSRRDG
jgi:hypothetical protein